MKRSDFCAMMATLWFIAASVQRQIDWTTVASMALFAFYAIASAVHVFWLERLENKP